MKRSGPLVHLHRDEVCRTKDRCAIDPRAHTASFKLSSLRTDRGRVNPLPGRVFCQFSNADQGDQPCRISLVIAGFTPRRSSSRI